MTDVVVLAGGYGGAKLSHGLAMLAQEPDQDLDLSIVVNTADDLELHGLLVCPDLDTVMYTLGRPGQRGDRLGRARRDLVGARDARAVRRRRPGSRWVTGTSPPTSCARSACAGAPG